MQHFKIGLGVLVLSLCAFANTPHSKASFVSSHDVLSFKQSQLGLYLLLEDHWHTYWQNPGDSGAPPKLTLKANPDVLDFSNILFHTPKRIDSPPLTSFGYEEEALFAIETNLKAEYKTKPLPKTTTVTLEAEWLVCKEECVPAFASFKKTFRLSQNPPALGPDAALFSHLFQPLLPSFESEATLTPKEISFFLPLLEGQNVKDFFIFSNPSVSYQKPLILREATGAQVTLQRIDAQTSPNPIEGLIEFETQGGSSFAPLKTKLRTTPMSAAFQWFLFAFLGGLILNIMPCVFPILSLKVFGFLGLSASQKTQTRVQALIYTLGVVFCFLLFAGIIFLFQKSGAALGWGFQLQSKSFLIFLILLFLILGLSFLDVVSFNFLPSSFLLKSKNPYLESFFSGLLAVVVASPCTAPFMGGALGFGLSQPWPILMITFVCLALGFAAPYLALVFFPALIGFLPRSGPWLATFKKWMSLPMFLTSLWLVWILFQNISPTQASNVWEPFAESTLQTIQAQNKPVFINFTADWCITCKVNEKITFSNKDLQKEIQSRGIMMLKADWTKNDPLITQKLKSFNRASVPFYVFYPQSGASVVILPEILTPSIFRDRVFGRGEK